MLQENTGSTVCIFDDKWQMHSMCSCTACAELPQRFNTHSITHPAAFISGSLSILDSLFYAFPTWLNCILCTSLTLPSSLSFFFSLLVYRLLCMVIHSLFTLHICFYDPHQCDESMRGAQIKCNEYCQKWKRRSLRFPARDWQTKLE